MAYQWLISGLSVAYWWSVGGLLVVYQWLTSGSFVVDGGLRVETFNSFTEQIPPPRQPPPNHV